MKKTLTSLGFALMFSMGVNAADTVPWSCDFSNTLTDISGWKGVAAYSSSKGMQITQNRLYMPQAVMNRYNEYYEFFTGSGFKMEAGKGYKFELKACTNNSDPSANNNFKIFLYEHSDDAKPSYNRLRREVLSGSKLITDFRTYSGYFEVDKDGVYDLCLYAYADYASRALYWDDFKLTFADLGAPGEPTLSVVPDTGGVLKCALTVTAPTTNIRGEVLNSLDKLEVYRDGGLVQTFEKPAPGESFSFTDYVAQPGNHTYTVKAYNENGEGAERNLMTVIGGVPEKQKWENHMPYWAKYQPDGTIRIEWPAATEETGVSYRVETTGGRVIEGTPTEFTKVTTEDTRNPDSEIKNYYIVDNQFNLGTEPTGLQYRVMKVNENGTEALAGYTNWLCLNNQVPYLPNMLTLDALNSFTRDRDTEFAWSASGTYVAGTADRPYGYHDKSYYYHNWLISPGLTLSKDKFYRVKLTACGSKNELTYTIKAGRGSDRNSLDIVVAEDHPTVLGDGNLNVLQTDQMFLSVPEDGQYFIGIVPQIPASISNATLYLKRFDVIEVDPTLPDAPTNVRITFLDNGGKIYFNVPTKAINGQDVSGINKVEVYKDGALFKTFTESLSPGAELSFDIDVIPEVQNVYDIRAYNTAGQGESATTQVFVLKPPYSNDFETKNSLNGFTQINNLRNGQDFHNQLGKVRLFYDEAGNDHWLITPPITLTAGEYYQFNYNLKASADEAGNCGVYLGTAPTAEAMTTTLNEFPVNAELNIFGGFHEEWFTVEETGQYFIGFHLTKEPGRHNKEIYLDDFSIAKGVAGSVPDMGQLKVTPAADGSLKATLAYTVPTTSLNGQPLNADSTYPVYFYINGQQTGGINADGSANPSSRTFNAKPGQTATIEVAVSEDLPYIFSAHAQWNGRITYQDAFVGINIPDYPDPDAIVITETKPYGRVKLSWEPVTKDIDGYDLNPDLLTYEVMILQPNASGSSFVETPVMTNIKGSSCEFDAVSPDAPQSMKRYVLRARNIRGKGSSGALTPYVNVGKPYTLPYQESFAGTNNQPGVKTAIYDQVLEGLCNWGLMYDGLEKGVTSGDGDGCYLAMESAYLDSRGRFYTGKVDLSTAQHPSFSLMLFNNAADGEEARNLVEFKIFTFADGKWHSLGEPKMVSELCGNRHGWSKLSIDLGEFAGSIAMCAIDVTCNQHIFTSFDNFRIWEAPEHDLSMLSHNAPVSAAPGVPFKVDVTVVNNGLAHSTPESLEMYVDDELVSTLEGTEIRQGESATFSFTHSFPVIDLNDTHELLFKVNKEDDGDQADNELRVTLSSVVTDLPGVENLTASVDANQYVTLSWDAPVGLGTETVTESFENWNEGETSRFGWTSYDADRRNILGFTYSDGSAVEIPGLPTNEPAAFAVVDVENGPLPGNYFPANTGTKFMASICPNGGVGSANDWLISPLLSGNAQTISFYLKNYSSYRAGFEVLYSTGSMNINDFKSVGTNSLSSGQWIEWRAVLPEGAVRFAIRNISYCEESFMLMVDDITYEPATGEKVALNGYNVYNEAECLASPTVNSYTAAEPMADGKYVFGVSALYAHGESKVLPVEVQVSGIAEVSVAAGVHVFGGNGCIHITGADGLDVAVYDLGGRLLNAGTVPASGRIAAANGVYVVTVDGESYKVLVK